jgi:hypothetical protein
METEKAVGLPETIRFVEDSAAAVPPNGSGDDNEKLIFGLPDVSKKTPEEIEEEREEQRWQKLSKPLTSDKKILDKLLVDPSDLGGDDYFKLDAAFRTQHHYVYSTSLNKNAEGLYLQLVLAYLNKIYPEDLANPNKISFVNVSRAMERLRLFLYS